MAALAGERGPAAPRRLSSGAGHPVIDFTERANERAVGWRWTSAGIHHELTWPRGTRTLLLGTSADGTHWYVATVDDPEHLPCAPTLRSARTAALRFITPDDRN